MDSFPNSSSTESSEDSRPESSTPTSADALRAEDRKQIRALLSDSDRSSASLIRALLQFGAERLGVEHGYLTDINVGLGTHTIGATSGSHPVISEGKTSDLSTTYCRQVLASGDLCVVQDAPNEGWANDPAYTTVEFDTYLGAKVLVGDQLYGTVCFVDAAAREHPLEAADGALVMEISSVLGQILEETTSRVTGNPREMGTELRQTQARLKALFEQNPVMINIHDGDGNLLDPNPRLCEETGYDEDELTNMKVWELDQSIDPEQAQALWEEMDIGDRKQVEGEYQRRDGSTFPAEVHLRHLDLDGDSQFMAISRNITERKTEERRRRQIISRVTDAIVEVDANWQFTLVNEQAEALYGMNQAELLGEHFWDVFSEALDTRLETEYRRVMETREPTRLVEHYSGLDAWFDIQVYPNDDGGVAFYFEDVTERKERERRLDAIFNHTYQFTGLMDPDGTLLEVNDTALTFGGLEEADVIGKPLWETPWAQTGEESKRQLREAIDRAAAGEFVRYERTVKGESEDRIVDFSIRPVTNDRDEVTLLIPEARDITERKETEEALRASEKLHRETLQNITDTVLIAEEDGTLTYVCPNVDHIFGHDQQEVEALGTVSALLGSDPVEEYSFNGNRELTNVEWRITDADGTPHDLLINIRPVAIQDGTRMYTCRDVTKRKEQERQLDAVFNQTYQFTGLLERDGTLIKANDTALQFGGLNRDDVIGKPIWETDWFQTGSETKERLEASVQRAAEGEFIRYEETVQGVDGTRVIDFSLRPIVDEDGNVTHIIPEGRDITERKEREKALREERNLLERIFRTSPTAITVLNSDGQFVRVSDRAREILGLEKDDVTDRAFNDPDWHITAPDGSPFPNEKLPFIQVKKTGDSVYDVEHAIEWPDGTRRLLSISGAPLPAADGSFAGAVFHLDDITERRETKRKLQRSEQRFRGVFENAGLGIALVNQEGILLEANPTLERMLAYDTGELAGMRFSTITHPDDLEADERLFSELLAGERDQYQIEKRYIRQSGEVFWGRLTVSRQVGPDGDQVVGMVEDIDEQRQQREELRLFQKIVEQAYDGVLITEGQPLSEPGPRITYANPAFGHTTGYDPEEIVGETPRLLQGPDTEPWVLHQLRRQLEQGLKFEGEAINYKKDGTPFINHWTIAPVYDEDDTITHWMSVQRDVTDERRMSKRLLEVQDDERRRIDQEIHDEMGGLLTSLQMTVDLARLQLGEESPAADHLNEIEDLLDDLAGVARTISRRLHPSSLDDYGLSRAFRSLADEVEARHNLDIELHNEVKSGVRYSSLVEITAYRVVQEALWNVVRHAETDAAQVIVQTSEPQLLVHVFDKGIGFDPSAQSDADNLGLDGMRRRIERLNGNLEIDSAPGEGTRISAMLPLTVSTLRR